jgi:hypothetical protein
MRLLAVVAALTLAVAVPATGAPALAAPSLAASGCPLFPADNVWHADVSRLPVHPRSGAYLAAMGPGAGIHADFGSGTWEGGPVDRRGLADLTAATAPGSSPTAARGPRDTGQNGAAIPGPALQLLAGLLGLVAAALAMRQLTRSRGRPPTGRHVRSAPAPPDPDPAAGRRR